LQGLFDHIENARSLAQVIVDTVREPLLVLDSDLNILFASQSFHELFESEPEAVRGRPLFALEDGTWDTAPLRGLVERCKPEQGIREDLEISQAFPRIGSRTLKVYARKVQFDADDRMIVLIGFDDLTLQRAIEGEKAELQLRTDDLLQQKEMLLEEMQHRIVNSLQIIASILMLKARAVTSEETRQHLQDAHRRVMSVAAVQRHLHDSGRHDRIDVAPYLTKLCASLSESMIGDSSPAVLIVVADTGSLASADAVSIGLVVTELVINALKYAFPAVRTAAEVLVRYEVNGTDWKLSVSDNGIGRKDDDGAPKKGGLGTSLVNALAHQLDAKVEVLSSAEGMRVSITHATFTSLAA
jgi:chemotaxis protein methyltransferase CheR